VTHRIVWPIAALLGLIVLVVGISNVPAQRFGGGAMYSPYPPQPGRFAVAHATATRVIILDTATGKLYRATEDDFSKMSDLPKFGMPPGPFPGPFDKDKDKPGPGRFIDKAKDRPGRFADKDKDRPPLPKDVKGKE
jgi:hypothetical protein